MYKVYVKTDETGRITSVNSDAFLPDVDGWTEIDEGEGDAFHHAQGNYLPKPLMTMQGIYQHKLVDGKVQERTAEEIAADIAAIPPSPPTTENKLTQVEEKLTAIKPLMTELVRGKPPDVVIGTTDFILPWEQGKYVLDDVRLWDGQPRRCCQAHDSTGNPTWTPAVASLWAPYHGTSPQTALPWVAPTGAHDMYKAGEYMVWTDGKVYKCKQDTSYSPGDYALAWEEVK